MPLETPVIGPYHRAGRLTPTRPIAVRVAAIVGTALLAWVAAAVGFDSTNASPWLVAIDVAVGVAFVGGALVAPGSARVRVLVGLVGVAWLIGSVAPTARLAHQTAMAAALLAFPTGRSRGIDVSIGILAAVPVGLLLVPQGFVALLFAAIALRAALRRREIAAAYPFTAAAGIAAVLGAAWLARSFDPFAYDPAVALVAYTVVLFVVAIGFPFAMRGVEDRSALQRRLLRREGLVGLDGLGAVLAEALGDPSIEVYRWDPARQTYVDASGSPAPPSPSRRLLPIMEAGEPLGAVAHRSAALDDERTAGAVVGALRLTLQNLRWQHALQEQLRELEVARASLLAAVDRERAAVAAQLRDDVVVHIGEAVAALREGAGDPSGDADDPLAIALGELAVAREELRELVNGLGPPGLGDGGLVRSLQGVAARSPLPVSVIAEPGAVGDRAAETALYYACMEALANAAKHASPRQVRITVRRDAGMLEATVTDDGSGGADPTGSGLQGLADRLAASGGRLRVDSTRGAGTTVIARLPASQSSATPQA